MVILYFTGFNARILKKIQIALPPEKTLTDKENTIPEESRPQAQHTPLLLQRNFILDNREEKKVTFATKWPFPRKKSLTLQRKFTPRAGGKATFAVKWFISGKRNFPAEAAFYFFLAKKKAPPPGEISNFTANSKATFYPLSESFQTSHSCCRAAFRGKTLYSEGGFPKEIAM